MSQSVHHLRLSPCPSARRWSLESGWAGENPRFPQGLWEPQITGQGALIPLQGNVASPASVGRRRRSDHHVARLMPAPPGWSCSFLCSQSLWTPSWDGGLVPALTW